LSFGGGVVLAKLASQPGSLPPLHTYMLSIPVRSEQDHVIFKEGDFRLFSEKILSNYECKKLIYN